ncbi:DUF4190 domain-containing protein [Streptomyces sp. NPDC051578]|uniref:DUF4190 domain-containing protein n=1 Tax=Streptomyces sp. NPDC051578 TaxID=3365662 RepID=UPI00378B21E4
MAIAALITGITSLLLLWLWFLGIPLALVAIGLGVTALRRVRAYPVGGRETAITGLTLGSVAVVLSAILVAAGVSLLNSDAGKNFRRCMETAHSQREKQHCADQFTQEANN